MNYVASGKAFEKKRKIVMSLEGCLSAANPKGLGATRLRTEAIDPMICGQVD